MLTESKSKNSLSNILDLKLHPVSLFSFFGPLTDKLLHWWASEHSLKVTMEDKFILQRRRLCRLFSIALSGTWDMLSSQLMKLSLRGWIHIQEGWDSCPSSALIFYPYSRNASHLLVYVTENSNSHWWFFFLMYSKQNSPSLRTLDSYLKEKLGMWLSPATLELHHITWDDPASLLEKIVAYEVLH